MPRFNVEDYVGYPQALDIAHKEHGLMGTSSDIVQFPSEENGNTCIVKVTVLTKNGVFAAIGDASPTNVGTQVAPHFIRMAETRAKARCLREAINSGADPDVGEPPQVDARTAIKISELANKADVPYSRIASRYGKYTLSDLTQAEADHAVKLLEQQAQKSETVSSE